VSEQRAPSKASGMARFRDDDDGESLRLWRLEFLAASSDDDEEGDGEDALVQVPPIASTEGISTESPSRIQEQECDVLHQQKVRASD